MELTNNYLLAGGIASVVMHPALSTLPNEVLSEGDDSLTMLLHGDGSTYVETRSCEDGIYTVRHTLTLVGYIGEDMANVYKLDTLLREGIVADVAFNSGAVARIGWSSKHGVSAPLRLVSHEVTTGEKRLDYPLKKWIWESVDETALL